MNNFAIRSGIGPEVLLLRGDSEESQAGAGIETKPDEDGVEDVVGELEGELGDGVEAL